MAETMADPNYPVDKRESTILERASEDDGDSFKDKDEEDSPYPEVRAAVHNYDEDVPANTIRAWTIGMILVIVGSSMNTLFSLRAPSIGLGALIAQIIAWPMGHGWARVMPKRQFQTFGIQWSLNPGPFNIKEHSIIVVMASVSFGAAYATDILLAQIAFYKQDFGILFQLLLVISTQSVGYGIAGMMRSFLVYVSSFIAMLDTNMFLSLLWTLLVHIHELSLRIVTSLFGFLSVMDQNFTDHKTGILLL